MIILTGLVVVSAGVLMVTLTHVVGYIAKAILRIYIAYETLLLTAVRAVEFVRLMARQFLTL